jgi:uncharacterized protein (TIGR03435 family)
MKSTALRLALAAFSTTLVWAQDPVGSWQGTLTPPQGKPLRLVMKVGRDQAEKFTGTFYSIDQNPTPIPATTVSLQGSTFKFTIAAITGNYEGRLNGDTITGTWTQGPGPGAPLDFARATSTTAWVIPEAPPPPKPMDSSAKPSFEVATIKPSNPDNRGKSILVGRGGGNTLTTTNTPLKELIILAYNLHPKQLIGGPSWVESENFDITAKPDRDGVPNVEQLKVMIRSLLEERFGLKFHKEQRQLSVYALTTIKSGAKIAKADPPRGNLPGFGGPPGFMTVRNATMPEFTEFLQARMVDQPVVDQTGLEGRYDLSLRYTPDAALLAQFGPGGPPPPPPSPDGEIPPDLFAAFERQLGLKLDSIKAPVDVIVIDKAEKPTEN